MSKKRRGLVKLLPILLAVVMISVTVICTAVPAGAYELTPEMWQNIQDFLNNRNESGGAVDTDMRDTLKDLAEDFLKQKQEEEAHLPENEKKFSEEAIENLHQSLKNETTGETDYGIIVDIVEDLILPEDGGKVDHSTVDGVLDMLDKIESAEELKQFVDTQKDYIEEEKKAEEEQRPVDIPLYKVVWVLTDGNTEYRYEDPKEYRLFDPYRYPCKEDMGIKSGEYIRWNSHAFLEADDIENYDPAKGIEIEGEVIHIMDKVVEYSDDITVANKVFKAVLDKDTNTLLLTLNTDGSNYLDVIADLRDGTAKEQLKSELQSLFLHLASAAMNAGVNEIYLGGHLIVNVSSYELDDLMEIFESVVNDGALEKLVNLDGIEAFLRDQDFTISSYFPTVGNRIPTVDPVTGKEMFYGVLADTTLTLRTKTNTPDAEGNPTYLAADTWTVKLALYSDEDTLDLVDEVVAWVEEAITITTIDGGKQVMVTLDENKMQLILEKVFDSLGEERLEGKITHFTVAPLNDRYFLLNGDLTIGELKEMIREADFDEIIKAITNKDVNLSDSDAFSRLLNSVLDRLPTGYDGNTLASLYSGNHGFAFDTVKDMAYFKDKATSLLGGFSITVAGHTFTSDLLIDHLFDSITIEDVRIRAELVMGDYRLYYYDHDGDPTTALKSVFARPGVSVAYLFGNPSESGYAFEFYQNGQKIEVLPDTDSNAPITCVKNALENKLTVNVLGDQGAFLGTIELSVATGTLLDDRYFLSLIWDQINPDLLKGYYYDSSSFSGHMPAEALAVDVQLELNTYEITWKVEGQEDVVTEVKYGYLPVYPNGTPAKAGDLNFTYTFKGWTPALVAVTADATYIAEFTPVDRLEGAELEIKDGFVFVTAEKYDLPLDYIVEVLKANPDCGLVVSTHFVNGYTMEITFTAAEVDHLLTQLEGKDDLTLSLKRESNHEGDVVNYGVAFYAGEDKLNVTSIGETTIAITADRLTTSEVYTVTMGNDVLTYTLADGAEKATVTFTLPNGAAYGDFTLTKAEMTYEVEVKPSENGQVTVTPENAAPGTTVTITATPDFGYEVGSVIVKDKDGNVIDVTGKTGSEQASDFTFTQPEGGATVEVIFVTARYTVTFVDAATGKKLGETTVTHGDKIEDIFDFVPETWYDDDFTYKYSIHYVVDDVCTLDNIIADITVKVAYDAESKAHSVTIVENAVNGSATIPMGEVLSRNEEDPNLGLDLTVYFEDGSYIKVFLSGDELAAIRAQLDAMTPPVAYDDVELYINRSIDATDPEHPLYDFDLVFRADGQDLAITGNNTLQDCSVTVKLPATAPTGYHYELNLPGQQSATSFAGDSLTFTIKEYSWISINDKINTYTVTFSYEASDGTPVTTPPVTVTHGDRVPLPTNVPANVYVFDETAGQFVTITFTGWDKTVEDGYVVNVSGNWQVNANYDDPRGTYPEGVTVPSDISFIRDERLDREQPIPFTPVLNMLKKGENTAFAYNSTQGNDLLNIIFASSADDKQALVAALEAALTSKELPADTEVTFRVQRSSASESALPGMPENHKFLNAYGAEISFFAGDELLHLELGNVNNSHEMNVPELKAGRQYYLISADGEGNPEISLLNRVGDKVTFPASHYSNYYVVEAAEYFTLSVGSTVNGAVNLEVNGSADTKAIVGDTVTVKATPVTGYVLDSVYYVMEGSTDQVPVSSGSFNMPEGNVTVYATFKEEPVTPPEPTYFDITADAVANATIEILVNGAPAAKAQKGDVITVKVTPATGYELTGVYYTLNGQKTDLTKNSDGNYTFDMPEGSVTVGATVNEIPAPTYTVTVGTTENVTITVTPASGEAGTEIAVTATPAQGYRVTRVYYVLGNGDTQTIENGKFKLPAENVTVKADVEPIPVTPDIYNVTVGTTENVTITVTPASGEAGTEIAVTATPAQGYRVTRVYYVLGNGDTQTIENGKFKLPAENVTVKADVELIPVTPDIYNVTVGTTENVTITVTPASGEEGTEITVTVTPADGYKVTRVYYVLSDGTEVVIENGKFNLPADHVTVKADVEVDEPDTSEPGTSEPGTSEPGTSEPGTSEPGITETEPTTDTEPAPAGCDGSDAWWIILLVVVLLVILGLIGYVLYQKGIFSKQIAETLEEEEPVEEEEEDTNSELLFIPLGEELPEEEVEEIHVVHEVSVDEVDELMSDYTAEHVLEESVKVGGTGKLGIINVGVLHDNFEDGDTVNLAALKEKDMIADSIGRLKVLASGSLDKALTVEADAFSVQAIKMITLTGGHAVKLRNVNDPVVPQKKPVVKVEAETVVEEATETVVEEATETVVEEATETVVEEATETVVEEATETVVEDAPEADKE